jgi:hypothetical protein
VVNEAPIEGTPTKKASIKKAGKVVGPESDEKENDIEAKKAEDIKMSSARKRPLEENDVEGQLKYFGQWLYRYFVCFGLLSICVLASFFFLGV